MHPIKPITQPLFAQHLEKLELLSMAARRLTEPVAHIASAEKTLAQVWDILSKSLPSEGVADMDDLATLSSIIQRTAAATKQIRSLESESFDLVRKAVDVEAVKQTILKRLAESVTADEEQKDGLTPETLSLIEERLRLL